MNTIIILNGICVHKPITKISHIDEEERQTIWELRLNQDYTILFNMQFYLSY